MYYANRSYRLSSPLDLLRFAPLSFAARLRLGLLVLRARRVREWRNLECRTAAEWLRSIGGDEVYRVVWEPLLRGKFGIYADQVSAVWMWNKLALRGGSRGKGGGEMLAYFRGGFAALAGHLAADVRRHGGVIRTGARVQAIEVRDGRAVGVRCGAEFIPGAAVLATTPLPVAADLLEPHLGSSYGGRLRSIDHLGNLCLVLELSHSLSGIYWLNVNDHGFPFVAVIEHTDFESPETYGGRHIVYLSKYLPVEDALYRLTDAQVLEFAIPHIQRMFPSFRPDWVLAHHVWRAAHSQPIVCCHYSRLIPAFRTPLPGMFLSSMAQIYPEDRGTNYAIREGRRAGRDILDARS